VLARTFYLIALGGTAMTPLAGLLVERGDLVLGSDLPLYPPMSDRIAALGIDVRPGFDAANIPEAVDRVVVGNLAGKDNPELVEALRRGLPVSSMPETLHDEFLAGRHPVVVAGTHGKTTTTALTAWLLAASGRSPGYLVGGEPMNLPAPSAIGAGPAFVVEGDEYSTSWRDKGPKFLHYAPRTLILTSVEFDHADLYRDLDAVKDAFRRGVALVPPDGLIVAHGGDPNVLDVLSAARAPVLLYRVGAEATQADGAGLVARDVSYGPEGSRFTVVEDGVPLFSALVPLAGRHNVANALAAIGAARPFGPDARELAAALASFGGVRRRLEVRGTEQGVTVVDDFAHHPTAVGETIRGARGRFPGRRLWAVFEPRSITGGRADFARAYLEALSAADAVAVTRPFHAARLGGPSGPGALDTHLLTTELTTAGVPAFDADGADALAGSLLPKLLRGDVVLVMSSGSFGGLCGKLLGGLKGTGGA
jgi:UDP-N-acetylmuramate: L-alanyl-gamma-D-glutamyl-meso-diaminopimelate ligase